MDTCECCLNKLMRTSQQEDQRTPFLVFAGPGVSWLSVGFIRDYAVGTGTRRNPSIRFNQYSLNGE